MLCKPSHLLAFAAIATSVSALNILVNNDDGFGSANIRELYRELKAAGHNAIMVAPAVDNSGQGGRISFPSSVNLSSPTEFNLIPAGSPSLGRDPTDSNIWYFNGTPAACTLVALDYVIPRYYNNISIDLLVSGPNFGNNVGPFAFTASGTIGATYTAVMRNIPAIAFSAQGLETRPYTWINTTTISGKPDPATIGGQLGVQFVSQLINATSPGEPLLPLGYGLNVNFPNIDTLTSENATCFAPPFVQTRISGSGAYTLSATHNSSTGLFTYGTYFTKASAVCVNGDCNDPTEGVVVTEGCYTSVSVFTTDFDAPWVQRSAAVVQRFGSLVKNVWYL